MYYFFVLLLWNIVYGDEYNCVNHQVNTNAITTTVLYKNLNQKKSIRIGSQFHKNVYKCKEKDYIKDLVKKSIKFFSESISVNRIQGKMNLKGNGKCGSISVPVVNVIDNTDLLIYVTVNDKYCGQLKSFSWSSVCEKDQKGRPIAALINFCKNNLRNELKELDDKLNNEFRNLKEKLRNQLKKKVGEKLRNTLRKKHLIELKYDLMKILKQKNMKNYEINKKFSWEIKGCKSPKLSPKKTSKKPMPKKFLRKNDLQKIEKLEKLEKLEKFMEKLKKKLRDLKKSKSSKKGKKLQQKRFPTKKMGPKKSKSSKKGKKQQKRFSIKKIGPKSSKKGKKLQQKRFPIKKMGLKKSTDSKKLKESKLLEKMEKLLKKLKKLQQLKRSKEGKRGKSGKSSKKGKENKN